MKNWLKNSSSQMREVIQSGCAEQMPIMLSVPLPYSFIEKALTYTAGVFDKRKRKRRYRYGNNTAMYRISATCDGTTLYMSFTCLGTGLTANIYSPVENGYPFNIIVPKVHLNVRTDSGRPWNWNKESDEGFVLVASNELFAILCNGWSSSVSPDDLFKDSHAAPQRNMVTGCNIGIGLWVYEGLRPFVSAKAKGNEEDFIEYRRSTTNNKNTTVHYGVENPIIDMIEPSAMVGVKPEHGRWLLNKAAKTTSKQKGELLLHFREGTPMFFGVSPMGTEPSLPYDAYGKGGKRGKYRTYSYTGKEHLVSIPRDSIGTKDISSLVQNSEQMFFGASDKKVILGWKVDDVYFLWEHDVQRTDVLHPMLADLSTTATVVPLHCENLRLPNVRDDFKLPSFLQGYENIEEEEEMTPEEAKILIRWWNDHVNAEIMAGRRPTQESVELFEIIKNRAE
jgi:hypothetical protein